MTTQQKIRACGLLLEALILYAVMVVAMGWDSATRIMLIVVILFMIIVALGSMFFKNTNVG